MPYPKQLPWKLTLDTVGAPDLWVTFKDPQEQPVSEYRKMQRANVILMRHQRDSSLPDDDELWAFTTLDDMLKELLVAWNLPHPTTDEPLPVDTDDPWEPVPMPVYRYVADVFRERLMALPKRG